MQRLTTATYGTVTEILDFKTAVFGNVKVRIGGFWWTLESLSTESKKLAIAGMYSGEYNYVVDWQGAARDLIAMEIIDAYIGELSRTANSLTGGLNQYGSPITQIGRLKDAL